MRFNVNWKKYFKIGTPIALYYTEKYDDKFIKQCVDKILDAKQKNKSSITLIQFKDGKTVATLHQSEYDIALDLMFNFCVHYQFYEICSIIKHKKLNVMSNVM